MTATTPPPHGLAEVDLLAHPPEGWRVTSWGNDACASIGADLEAIAPRAAACCEVKVWLHQVDPADSAPSGACQLCGEATIPTCGDCGAVDCADPYCSGQLLAPVGCNCGRYGVNGQWWGPTPYRWRGGERIPRDLAATHPYEAALYEALRADPDAFGVVFDDWGRTAEVGQDALAIAVAAVAAIVRADRAIPQDLTPNNAP